MQPVLPALHGQHSFHSNPLIIRAGGLIEALGPEVARREVDPEGGNVTLDCAGFKERDLYPRQTPCDQDDLRKLARDTSPDELEDWYNRHVAAMYRELGAFDADRVIIYRQQYFAFYTLLEHMEMTLSLEGKARRRALAKARQLLHDPTPPIRSLPAPTPPGRTARPLTSELQ